MLCAGRKKHRALALFGSEKVSAPAKEQVLGTAEGILPQALLDGAVLLLHPGEDIWRRRYSGRSPWGAVEALSKKLERHPDLDRRWLRERYGISTRRAELIARDQIGTLSSKLAQAKQQESGGIGYIWRTSQDERVVGDPGGLYPKGNERHGNHYERDGVFFRWDQPPHDGHPGEAINCRCTAEPVWYEEDVEDVEKAGEKHLELAGKVEEVKASPPIRSVGGGPGTPRDFYDKVRPTDRIKPQEKEYSCGVACVRQVLEDAGISLTERELRDRIGYDFYERILKGVPGNTLGQVLNKHGLKARAGTAEPEYAESLLRNSREPFIALINNHWVIVDSSDGDIVKVRDPWGESGPGSPTGLEGKLPVSKFMEAWRRGRMGIIQW